MANTSPPLIHPSDRFFVAGHRGMAGSAICRALQRHGYTNLFTAGREALDLEDPLAVRTWFEAQQPEVVLLAAASSPGPLAGAATPWPSCRSCIAICGATGRSAPPNSCASRWAAAWRPCRTWCCSAS
ncbi:NAD-dependent epimerase/dehydratase family protein [Cyanobium sp. N5-Cardenillas]|uniref:NAD-dependent epimerase/dehydratase family protein n=1 Tax=Cyanobium sp. N5-Cardenillas TaxID=2823720 RepID=UPI0028F4042A|nr:NAD-dependent epimerase/dehydratase family protein [Cyanobium sp. N5-Cardenillas]MCP9785154.1 NAD-dependent epimerase/dehydratase family protein [Cyanobium sp. N5-Cardenillas]